MDVCYKEMHVEPCHQWQRRSRRAIHASLSKHETRGPTALMRRRCSPLEWLDMSPLLDPCAAFCNTMQCAVLQHNRSLRIHFIHLCAYTYLTQALLTHWDGKGRWCAATWTRLALSCSLPLVSWHCPGVWVPETQHSAFMPLTQSPNPHHVQEALSAFCLGDMETPWSRLRAPSSIPQVCHIAPCMRYWHDSFADPHSPE